MSLLPDGAVPHGKPRSLSLPSIPFPSILLVRPSDAPALADAPSPPPWNPAVGSAADAASAAVALKPRIVLNKKPSFTQLPQLTIPLKDARAAVRPLPEMPEPETPALETPASSTGPSPASSAPPETPATPGTPASPLAGVVDLTKCVTTTSAAPLTHGGFSDIYLGEWARVRAGADKDAPTETETVQVAIKLLRIFARTDQDGVKARKRLNREVYVWHHLAHPNIVRLFGTTYHMSGRPAMVMQWYANGCAAEYLRDKNPAADRLALICDVARGLRYLHTLERPIVHGDLKGNNILITDAGRAALSDFGLSRVIDDLVRPAGSTNTPSNPCVGPIRWQAPELLSDEGCRPSPPADVWSFACTAYEILTGEIPYPHRVREAHVIQDILGGVPPPRPGAPRAPHACVWPLLARCWAPDPARRPTMVAAVAALEALVGAGAGVHADAAAAPAGW